MSSDILVLLYIMVLPICYGLQCYQCGQYNDGVGSVTPCINNTHIQLKDCPLIEQIYCIKYVNEGTTIRDCVQKCIEKENWGTRTYCCSEDGCNSSTRSQTNYNILLILPIISTALVKFHHH